MGARRDDMSGSQRTQIALAALAPNRLHGTITRLARQHGLTRQTIYTLAASAQRLLTSALTPQPPGPQPPDLPIRVDGNRLRRTSLVLAEVGVYRRDIGICLAEALDTPRSPAWVNRTLAQLEQAAATVNAHWHPASTEILAGDEIFSHGQPNLLVVGNQSLFIYALTRQRSRDGDTWGCVLLDLPECPQFASDAGTGLAAGVRAAALPVQQLDWDHLLRPLWGQAARLERQAYAALQAVEDRFAQFDRARGSARLAQHLAVWERLQAEAAEAVARYDTFAGWVGQVDGWFGLIDLESGQLRDGQVGAAALRTVSQQVASWRGQLYAKLSRSLRDWAEGLFAYVPVLQQALNPLIEQWGEDAVQALARVWQVEASARRHRLDQAAQRTQQGVWATSLDRAVALLGEDELWVAWTAVRTVLERPWRGSMLAENVNSRLRPWLAGRKQSDQGCLELFRFLHNVRPFARGKRAEQSPAQAVGIELPADPLTLLGLAPKVSI
jgi:hypothetical protein